MLHILNATGRLSPYEEQIRHIVEKAVNKYTSLVEVSGFEIVVAENPDMAIKEHGIGGYTGTPQEIYISLDLGHERIKEMIEAHLGPTVAHELTHISRLQAGRPLAVGGTLADNVIGEGLADTMSVALYPAQDTPWIKSLNNTEFSAMKEKFLNECAQPYYNHSAWFYGSQPSEIPRWTGYHLGYALVNDYLTAHPELKIQDIISSDTADILSIWTN